MQGLNVFILFFQSQFAGFVAMKSDSPNLPNSQSSSSTAVPTSQSRKLEANSCHAVGSAQRSPSSSDSRSTSRRSKRTRRKRSRSSRSRSNRRRSPERRQLPRGPERESNQTSIRLGCPKYGFPFEKYGDNKKHALEDFAR